MLIVPFFPFAIHTKIRSSTHLMSFMMLLNLLASSILSLAVAHPFHLSPRDNDTFTLFVAHQARGILTLSFDPSKVASESLKVIETNTQGGYRPQWLTFAGDQLYSLSRQQFPNASSVDGGIYSFERYGTAFKFQNAVDSGGDGSVYVDVSPDKRTLAAANM